MVIGGTAGQVIICDLASEAGEDADVPVIKSDLVTEKEGFTWKGHQALLARPGPFKMPVGFQPRAFVQISPPASINSLVIFKAMKSSHLLGPFCGSEFWGFSLLKI